MRVPLGVAVFSGMLGVTFFGLVFTPVFYSIVMRFAGKSATQPRTGAGTEHEQFRRWRKSS